MALKPAHLQWSEDGTPENPEFGDVYFQKGKGVAESTFIFLNGSRLPARFAEVGDRTFHIAELGFGSGLNFLLTADLWRKTAPKDARLFYVSVEKHPVRKEDLARMYATWPELKAYSDTILAQYPPLIEGFHHIHLPDANIQLMLLFGDVADVLPELTGMFDAWYLDGFSPAKNPDMWAQGLYSLIAERTKQGGTVATFSVASLVRQGLQDAGFEVTRTKGFGVNRKMVTAVYTGAAAVLADNHKRPVTVLGAGLAGCSAAWALARRGYDVTVMDRQQGCAQETSGNIAAVLYPKLASVPSPVGPFHCAGFLYTRGCLDVLDVEWNPCGVVHLDKDEEAERRTQKRLSRSGYSEDYAQIITAQDKTGLGIDQQALYQPLAGVVSPPKLCEKLLSHPRINTVYGEEVSSLPKEGLVVVALGMNSQIFDETSWLPLQSIRGQMSYVAATVESEKLDVVISHEGVILPAIDGVHCVGATFQQESPALPELRQEDHDINVANLHRYIPALNGCSKVIGGRTGYRVNAPDRLPMAGSCPAYAAFIDVFACLCHGHLPKEGMETVYVDNVYVSTAFGAHGLSGSLLAGEIIAAQIAGDPLPIPKSLAMEIAPERFILRDLKKNRI